MFYYLLLDSILYVNKLTFKGRPTFILRSLNDFSKSKLEKIHKY